MVQGKAETVASEAAVLAQGMSQAFRVLLCCEHYPPSVGGVQEVMRQIAERLASFGWQVTVATSTHPARAVDTLRNGVRVVSFPISGNLTKGMTGPLAQYQSFLEDGRFDAILIKAAQQWTFDAAVGVLPRLSARKLFIPCGFSGLNDPRYKLYYQDMPTWLKLFDGLIFYASEYQDIAFARQHGLTYIHCLPNGVDEREFADPDDHDIRSKLGIPASHDLLLTVGSQIAAKGHWEVLRAFSKAHLPRPATLIINGNVPGKGKASLLKRTIKHGLTGRWPLTWEVRWRGLLGPNKRVLITDVPRPDLVNLYKSADLFVLASHVEYSPLVLFEAAAAGTAFLSSPAGNSKEIAQWTGAGLVLETRSSRNAAILVSDLAQKMEQLIFNPLHLANLGKAGRESIFLNGFTWHKIVEKYHNLIRTQ